MSPWRSGCSRFGKHLVINLEKWDGSLFWVCVIVLFRDRDHEGSVDTVEVHIPLMESIEKISYFVLDQELVCLEELGAKAIWTWCTVASHGKESSPSFFHGEGGLYGEGLVGIQGQVCGEVPKLSKAGGVGLRAQKITEEVKQHIFFPQVVKERVSKIVDQELDWFRVHADGGAHVMKFSVLITQDALWNFPSLALVVR